MDAADLEKTLRDLDRVATPVRRRPDRETWRFDFNGRAFYLHFYPPVRRRLRRGAATAEFVALKTLQTLKLPAVLPVAILSGLQFGDRKGDAVLTAAVEPAVRLDAAEPADHVRARTAVLDWLTQLAAAGLGHADLRPNSFLLTPTGVVLADAVGLARNGLTREHLAQFAFAAGEQATLGDRVRAWRRFNGADPEAVPPVDRHFDRRVRRAMAVQPIGRTRVGEWAAHFLATAVPVEWSAASRLSIAAADWRREWPRLAAMLEADALDVLKRDGSGDVLATRITLAGVPIDVILKRPRNKSKLRDVLDVWRPSRAQRTWTKSRRLLAMRVKVERPLAMFRGRAGEVLIFERVPGVTLEHSNLDALSPTAREMLFRRCGRMLRQLENARLAHTDAKSSNWIVFDSPTRGPTPVMIDAYGVRWLNPWLNLFGLHRLLRAMKHHPQYTPADSLHICQGFAPRASPGTEAGAATDAR